jgi:hypothetical protein
MRDRDKMNAILLPMMLSIGGFMPSTERYTDNSYGNNYDNRRAPKQHGTPWYFNEIGECEIKQFKDNIWYTHSVIYATNKTNAIRKWRNKYGRK